jgi:hypothetical protein
MLTIRLKACLFTERIAILIFCVIFIGLVAVVFNNSSPSSSVEVAGGAVGINDAGSLAANEQHNQTENEYEINDPGPEAQLTSKTIADELLDSLMKRIGDGRGPIIVGGIGDSGTRGMRDVLQHLGTQMLGEGYVNPISKDSQIYMDTYVTITTKGKQFLRSPSGLYNEPLRRAHSLKYNSTTVSFDHWNCGRQFVAKMVARSMAVSQRMRGEGIRLDPWGFKHPRTSLLLPYWIASLGNKFVFVHLLRDGKDIIEGDNQKMYRSKLHVVI